MTKISTEVVVNRRAKDGWYVYTSKSDLVPGLYVASRDDHAAYMDVLESIKTLLRLEFGWEIDVAHKLGYELRLVAEEEAKGAAAPLVIKREPDDCNAALSPTSAAKRSPTAR